MQNERKRILKMVEEGKLKVEEALTLLEELDKAEKTMEQKQAEIVKELTTAVHFEEAKKEEPFQYKFQSAKDKIFEFVDSALKKIKDFDLDFNFGQSVEISHIFQQNGVYLKEMDLDIANGSMKIVPWNEQDVRIECQAKVYRVETQEQARQNFLKDVFFAIEGEKLRFGTQQKWMKVEAVVYIPRTEYERARIRMFNGPISGENLNIGDLRVKTANGKIEFTAFEGNRMEAETANGHIKIEHSRISALEAETINGAIELSGDFKKAEAQTLNGNISCHLMGKSCESFSAKGTTGSIDLFLPAGTMVDGELRSNLGSFNVKLDGIQIVEEKSEKLQKLLRFKSIDTAGATKIFADTKTGAITVDQSDIVNLYK